MRPVILDFFGLQIQSYGVSKALAAIAAGWLLQRELIRGRLSGEHAFPLTLAGVVGGFAGAKVYYLVEVGSDVSLHDLGGTGFTWYGGVLGGTAAVLWIARRRGLPLWRLAAMATIPLAVAYAMGRLGCLLAGDGTYGGPSDLPWAMSFPNGTVPTTDRVHPAPLYEAILAFATAALLWRFRDRLAPRRLFGLFAIAMGSSRAVVEIVRLNDPVVVGLTMPQLFSFVLVALGLILMVGDSRRDSPARRKAIVGASRA
ncbi:MAG: prolipoprotein diacylglyceryl transferase [Solirubrobacteraceae bacterium]